MKNLHGVTRKKKRQAGEALQRRQLQRAADLFAQVCKLDPGDGESWTALAMVHGELGRYRDAERCCRRALQIDPNLGRAHYVLGKVLKAMKDSAGAVAHFERALALKAGGAELYNDLGNALLQAGRPRHALDSYNQALCLSPGYTRALFNLGGLRQMLGQPDQALACYRRALALEPDNVQFHYMVALVSTVSGAFDEALDHYGQMLRLEPGNLDAVAGIASVYDRRGEHETAYEWLRPHLQERPSPGIAVVFGDVAPRLGRQVEAAAVIERILQDESPAAQEQACGLCFRLADLYDAQGRYQEAFDHYQRGNSLRTTLFNPARHVEAIDTLIQAYAAGTMSRAPKASVRSGRPLFIVGMPRSGTTLTEQILASHPQVHGAGELHEIDRLVFSLPELTDTTLPDPQRVLALTVAELDALAGAYLERLEGLDGDASRVTDKMPYNFLHLGLLSMLFPGARVIHCVRDPLDTCLSCFFKNFSYGNSYAFDLGHLGLYYRQYQRLMAHWREVVELPVLDVRYEDLVADPEAVSRSLVDFCGLPWDPACLRFYENPRVVNTASYDQVRRPVYRDSVGRWRRYQAFIEPLREALGCSDIR